MLLLTVNQALEPGPSADHSPTVSTFSSWNDTDNLKVHKIYELLITYLYFLSIQNIEVSQEKKSVLSLFKSN